MIRRCFLWHSHKELHEQKRPICLASWSIFTRSKQLVGLGVRDLTHMNKSLMLKWMWEWVQPNHMWWKKAMVTLGPHIRPWEMVMYQDSGQV
jgi:hypothetical protein